VPTILTKSPAEGLATLCTGDKIVVELKSFWSSDISDAEVTDWFRIETWAVYW
jgi:hypothetical protein